MKCSECFHKDACGEASMYNDADQCKNAYPATHISALEAECKRLEREIDRLVNDANFANHRYHDVVKYMTKLEEALMANNFILAGRILESWSCRNDDA